MISEMVTSAYNNIGFFLYQLGPNVKRVVRRLERLHLKILKKKRLAVFIQTSLYIYTHTHIYIYIYIYIYILDVLYFNIKSYCNHFL